MKIKEINRMVVKIGSSLLIDKDKGVNNNFLNNISEDIVLLKKRDIETLIVSSGAIELGKIELPQSYPEGLINSTIKECEIDNYLCIKTKAIAEMTTRFKRSKKYNDRNPGSQIYAMALYEIYYLSKLKESENSLRIFKENWPEKIVKGKKISSLIKNNET